MAVRRTRTDFTLVADAMVRFPLARGRQQHDRLAASAPWIFRRRRHHPNAQRAGQRSVRGAIIVIGVGSGVAALAAQMER
jgi:hypothetical protein